MTTNNTRGEQEITVDTNVEMVESFCYRCARYTTFTLIGDPYETFYERDRDGNKILVLVQKGRCNHCKSEERSFHV